MNAVWLHQKYPNFVDGAWSSSALLEKQFGVSGCYKDIEGTMNLNFRPCVARIRSAFTKLGNTLDNGGGYHVINMRILCAVQINNF